MKNKSDIHEKHKNTQAALKKLNTFALEIDQQLIAVDKKADKIKGQMKVNSEIAQDNVNKLKQDFTDELDIIVKNIEKSNENIAAMIEASKKSVLMRIDAQEDKIMNWVKTKLEEQDERNSSMKEVIDQTMKDTIAKNKEKISKIKDICSRYFDKYD